MGDGAFETEDEMAKIWRESMQDVNLRFINYEDFVLLMKRQKRDSRFLRSSMEATGLGPGLSAMPEITEEEEDDHPSPGPRSTSKDSRRLRSTRRQEGQSSAPSPRNRTSSSPPK